MDGRFLAGIIKQRNKQWLGNDQGNFEQVPQSSKTFLRVKTRLNTF